MTFILNGQIGWTMGTETNERHLSHYDNDVQWTVEAYDERSTAILDAIGATAIETDNDGVVYECTPLQLIRYIATLHGVPVEMSKKRRVLSREEKQRRRERLASARSKITA